MLAVDLLPVTINNEVAGESILFFTILEYLAVFSCGVMGGIAAIQKNYNLFAILTAGFLTALGGGVMRDIMMGIFPPAGISNKGYVITAIVAALIVAMMYTTVKKHLQLLPVFDALGVGLFAVDGSAKALTYHMSGMTAVLLGVVTALGGSLVRDILLNEVPMIIQDRHWYAFLAVFGAGATVGIWRLTQRGYISFALEMFLDIVVVICIVLLRMASLYFNLLLPGASQRDLRETIRSGALKVHKLRNRSLHKHVQVPPSAAAHGTISTLHGTTSSIHSAPLGEHRMTPPTAHGIVPPGGAHTVIPVAVAQKAAALQMAQKKRYRNPQLSKIKKNPPSRPMSPSSETGRPLNSMPLKKESAINGN